jgi:broad specificity phosphatase PhoE
MRIYIRHADKEYDNGKSDVFMHDPRITRETAEALISQLSYKYFYDVNISEYLGNRKHETIDVTPEMLKFNPPTTQETRKQFKMRISQHEKTLFLSENSVTWVISHGLTIANLLKQIGNAPSSFDPLGFVCLSPIGFYLLKHILR